MTRFNLFRHLTRSTSRRRSSSTRHAAYRRHDLVVDQLEERALLAGDLGIAEMVEDVPRRGINPGSGDIRFRDGIDVDGTLYFVANDGINGRELWRTTSSGQAEMVEDAIPGGGLFPGSDGSYPEDLLNVDGTLYFKADDGTNGTELWRVNSSGQAEMVEDAIPGGGIQPGSDGSGPNRLTNVGGTLYFSANEGTNGNELWRINSSGQAEMVEDAIPGGGINPGSYFSSPRELTDIDGTLYFQANDGTNGFELWRVNSSGQAEMVEDAIPGGGINPGEDNSRPERLTDVDGTLYFRADDGTNGYELWRINSFGQAEMVEDTIPGGGIFPGSVGSYPSNLLNVDGTLYFRAEDETNGTELWRIDSAGQAELVEDAIPGGGIRPGDSGSSPAYLTNVDGTLYFEARDVNGEELWRINSSGQAELVEDAIPGGGINPGSSSSDPHYLTNVNGTLYFQAEDGTNGYELWRINSAGQAEMVEDSFPGGGINPGSDGSYPAYLFNIDGTLYFQADSGDNGYDLWKINSAGQAELVEVVSPPDGINPGRSDANPDRFVNIDGTLYFTADDGTNGIELWRTTSSGEVETVEDAIPGGGINPSGHSFPGNMTNLDGTIYFTATDGINGDELWRINSAGVAEMVEDAVPGGGISPGSSNSFVANLALANGTLYFSASDGTNGQELWRINSSGQAEMVEDAIPGGGINASGGSNPENMTSFDGTLYFQATDGVNGSELWRVNGSGQAEMVEDAIPGGGINPGSVGAYPNGLVNVDGTLYFTADDGTNGHEVWQINSSGQAEIVEDAIPGGGIRPGATSSIPRNLTDVDGTLYFEANDGTNGKELWRVNSSGQAEMVDGPVPGGGIKPGSGGAYPRDFANVNGTLYFAAEDGTNGRELWRINSSGQAEMVEGGVPSGGVYPGESGSYPDHLTNVDGTLYFTATVDDDGYELWRINSSGQAEMVDDTIPGGGIYPGSGGYPYNLTNVDGTLYFNATDGTNGYELWRINSSGQAEMVEDAIPGGGIFPGSDGSYPEDLLNVDGTLYFVAEDATNGRELWRIAAPAAPTLDPIVTGTAISGALQVALSWVPNTTNPSTRVVRKIGSYPTSPTDGTTVYEGTDTSFVDNDGGSLAAGTYYYAFFATDGGSGFSPPVDAGTEGTVVADSGLAPTLAADSQRSIGALAFADADQDGTIRAGEAAGALVVDLLGSAAGSENDSLTATLDSTISGTYTLETLITTPAVMNQDWNLQLTLSDGGAASVDFVFRYRYLFARTDGGAWRSAASLLAANTQYKLSVVIDSTTGAVDIYWDEANNLTLTTTLSQASRIRLLNQGHAASDVQYTLDDLRVVSGIPTFVTPPVTGPGVSASDLNTNIVQGGSERSFDDVTLDDADGDGTILGSIDSGALAINLAGNAPVNENDAILATLDSSNTGVFTTEFEFTTPAVLNQEWNLQIELEDGAGNEIRTAFRYRYFFLRNDANTRWLQVKNSLQTNTTYKLSIVINTTAGTADYYVDDVLTARVGEATSLTGLSQFRFTNLGNATADLTYVIDNVRVVTGNIFTPPPAPMSATVDVAVVALVTDDVSEMSTANPLLHATECVDIRSFARDASRIRSLVTAMRGLRNGSETRAISAEDIRDDKGQSDYATLADEAFAASLDD